VLTVVWTAYPTAFGSIASTLSIPLFIAAVGIIFRGVAYTPRTTLIAVTVAVLGGAVILFPSLALLFRLVLSGRLAEGGESVDLRPTPRLVRASRQGFVARAVLACLIAGIGLLTAAEAAWAHALGVVSLFGFVAFGFPAALPPHVVPHTNETKR
jgi:hypothetical protein